jgi:hypothetical protein
MARSAQDKFNDYLNESRETNNAVNEFVQASYDNNDRTYAYAAGYLQSMIKDVISELPKARRAEIRKRFLDLAQTQKNELLIKTLKETENA